MIFEADGSLAVTIKPLSMSINLIPTPWWRCFADLKLHVWWLVHSVAGRQCPRVPEVLTSSLLREQHETSIQYRSDAF